MVDIGAELLGALGSSYPSRSCGVAVGSGIVPVRQYVNSASPVPLVLKSGRSGQSSPEDGDGSRSTVPYSAILSGSTAKQYTVRTPQASFPDQPPLDDGLVHSAAREGLLQAPRRIGVGDPAVAASHGARRQDIAVLSVARLDEVPAAGPKH